MSNSSFFFLALSYSSYNFFNKSNTFYNAAFFAANISFAYASSDSAIANSFLFGSTIRRASYVSITALIQSAKLAAAVDAFSNTFF